MKRACLSLFFVAGLAFPASAGGQWLSRTEAARCNLNGTCELFQDPAAEIYDDGYAYGIGSIRIVGAAVRCSTGSDIYVWDPTSSRFRFMEHLGGYAPGMSGDSRYGNAIGEVFASNQRLRISASTPSKNETWRFLRHARRSLGISRRAFVLWLGVAALFSLLLLAALTVMVTKILTTISDIAIRHRLVSHANKALGAIKRGSR